MTRLFHYIFLVILVSNVSLSKSTLDPTDHLVEVTSPANNSLVLDDSTALEYLVSDRAPAHWQVNIYLNTIHAFKGSERSMRVLVPGMQQGRHILQIFMTDEHDQRVSAEVPPSPSRPHATRLTLRAISPILTAGDGALRRRPRP